MRTRRRPPFARRIARALAQVAFTAVGLVFIWNYGQHAIGSAVSDIFADHVPASEPRITRGGDAWSGTTGGARRVVVPQPEFFGATAEPGTRLIDVVTRIRDGDTIVVGLIPIRIANLDCAESGTVAGERATSRITELVRGQQLTCMLEGRRSWDREVGVCALPSGQDIGEVLIREGACERWR